MKKVLGLVLLFCNCLLYNYSYASIFGVDATLFKKETKNINTELSAIKNLQMSMNTNVNAEVGTLKSSIRDLSLSIGQINQSLSAKVSGIDNSKNKSTSVGGNQAITNDTKIFEIQKEMYESQIKVWKYLFYAIIVVVVSPLIGLISWTLKAMFKEMRNARFYQTSVAKLSKNGEFDDIMKQKREYEKLKKENTLLAKTIKLGKDFISKKGGSL